MRHRLFVWTIAAAMAGAGLALAAAPAHAQETGYTAPRTADGTPDLNGIWQALNNAHWNVEPHSADFSPVRELGALGAVPGGLGVVEGGTIPYTPEGPWRSGTRTSPTAWSAIRPSSATCRAHPRATYMPYPFQIIQSRSHIMILHEFAGAVRTIYMDDHMESPADTWMGWSNGHWEGETLVVETSGFYGDTWLDRAGNHHSTALRVVERFTARSPETLDYHVTLEDPNVYTRPWSMRMPLYRRVEPNAELMEFRCVEFVEDLIYGHLRKKVDQ